MNLRQKIDEKVLHSEMVSVTATADAYKLSSEGGGGGHLSSEEATDAVAAADISQEKF